MLKSHRRSSPTQKCVRSGQKHSDALPIAQTSPAGLALITTNGKWQLANHLSLIDEKLMAVAAGDIKRLMLCLPPRHGKSELVSRYFPASYLWSLAPSSGCASIREAAPPTIGTFTGMRGAWTPLVQAVRSRERGRTFCLLTIP